MGRTFYSLLNKSNPSNPSVLDALPNLTPVNLTDEPPEFSEILSAVRLLKNNKALGPGGLPAEVLEHGGYILTKQLHKIIQKILDSESNPQQWKDSNIITIYTKKGDKAECDNSCGISLKSSEKSSGPY